MKKKIKVIKKDNQSDHVKFENFEDGDKEEEEEEEEEET
jgi:hypothetical protein